VLVQPPPSKSSAAISTGDALIGIPLSRCESCSKRVRGRRPMDPRSGVERLGRDGDEHRRGQASNTSGPRGLRGVGDPGPTLPGRHDGPAGAGLLVVGIPDIPGSPDSASDCSQSWRSRATCSPARRVLHCREPPSIAIPTPSGGVPLFSRFPIPHRSRTLRILWGGPRRMVPRPSAAAPGDRAIDRKARRYARSAIVSRRGVAGAPDAVAHEVQPGRRGMPVGKVLST
jgi:hypothetical protein